MIVVDELVVVSCTMLDVYARMRQGNSALHYAMSNGHFEMVKLLLDTGMCDTTRQNKTGCTVVMLASLVQITTHADRQIIKRLFELGDINQQASLVISKLFHAYTLMTIAQYTKTNLMR